jgi:hypothetical protein
MAEDKESLLARWSRLKRASTEAAKAPAPASTADGTPLPEPPPLEGLDHDSDFSAFMDRRVDDGLRRLALKKLFSDPRFNVTDGLDVYAEDYSQLEDLPQALVERLAHARRTLRGPEPEPQQPAPPEQSAADAGPPPPGEAGPGASEANPEADRGETPRREG